MEQKTRRELLFFLLGTGAAQTETAKQVFADLSEGTLLVLPKKQSTKGN